MKWIWKICLFLLWLPVILLTGCATKQAMQADIPGAGSTDTIASYNALTAVPSSVFTQCSPLSFSEIDASLFSKDWYALPMTSGKPVFNPLFLAFKYVCRKGEPDTGQTLTFPSLLSFKFDFVPDNFNASHPFFIFRKDPGVISLTPVQKEEMLSYCKSRDATHLITGELIQEGNKYAGSIRVYDRNCVPVYEKSYKAPEEYFTLMGKMVQGWMEFRKQAVNPGLQKELYRPMTKDLRTVRWLGESFGKQWGSAAEWEIYEKILTQDPGFGEVQYWYANQKGQVTGNYLDALAGKGKALQDHPVIPALREFSTELCLDDKLNTLYRKTADSLQSLLGDVPLIAYLRLKDLGKSMSTAELDAFIPTALKHPSHYALLEILAYQYDIRNQYEKALPLYLSALDSGYKPDDGKFDTVYIALSHKFRELGYINEAANFCLHGLNYCQPARRPFLLEALGYAFSESFIFSRAAQLFKESYLSQKQMLVLFAGYMNLYQGGEDIALKEWKSNKELNVLKGSFQALVEIRDTISRGYYYPAETLLADFAATVKENFPLMLEAAITSTDLYLLHKQSAAAQIYAARVWSLYPRSRKTAFLVEKSFTADLTSLGYYAEVANLIFKGDVYYRNLLQRVKTGGYVPFDDSVLVTQYNAIAAKQTVLNHQEELKFWQSWSPFYIEYLALRLLRMNSVQYKEAGVRLYIAYSKALQSVSKYQEIHARTFFRMLISPLSKTEKAGWLEVFEYEM